jgi:hypothetical protein
MFPKSAFRLIGVLALAAMMVVSVAAAGDASLRIFWRYLVLSYDNPITQHADELACESSPISQAGADARHFTRLACRPAGHLASADVELYDAALDLGAGITRAPPSV